jgi:excisionase family DNA binding protein
VRIELEPEERAALVEEITRAVLDRLAAERDNGSPWLSAQGAADYLGVSRKRIYARVHELPHFRDGARVFFRKDELDAYLEGCRER